jgi:hypothetical protein
MQHRRIFVSVLASTLAAPVFAGEVSSDSPYGQVRSAVASMETMDFELNAQIERRIQRGRGKAIECMKEHHATLQSLLDLSQIERAHLVEAMADGEPAKVAQAHRNVMLWHIKAKVAVDKVGACPSQRDYDVAKAVAEAEALGRD